MRPKVIEAGAMLLVGVALVACDVQSPSAPSDTPSYCQKLAQMPSGLQDAIVAAAAGVASDDDRVVISKGTDVLKSVANDSSTPDDARVALGKVTAVLGKLAQGQSLSSDDVAIFTNLGEAVPCAAK